MQCNMVMDSVDNKLEPSSPTPTLLPVMAVVDIKVEPGSPTATVRPVMDDVDIKVEPGSPTAIVSPVTDDVDIKMEPGSPTATVRPVMDDVDIKVEPGSPTTTVRPVMDDVDIKVEPGSPTATVCPVMEDADIKVEPGSPTATVRPRKLHMARRNEKPLGICVTTGLHCLRHPVTSFAASYASTHAVGCAVMEDVDIKVEPGSPPATVCPVMLSFEVKEEPRSPTAMLAPDTTCDDAQEEMIIPHSPPPELSHESPLMNDGEPYELAALQPCVTDSTPLTSVTETSRDEATMDSNSGIPGGTTVASETEDTRNTSVDESHESLERPSSFTDCLRIKKEKKYKCKQCPSAYSKPESLVKHKELHARGVKMFHCHKCNRMYLKEEGLHAHLRWHATGKPYTCHLCPAKFIKKAHRDSHVLRHKGEKRHVCSVCEKRFAEACDCRSHMLRAHHIGNLKSPPDVTRTPETSSTETSRKETVMGNEPRLSIGTSVVPRRKTHTNEPVRYYYACDQCPAKFLCKGPLGRHKQLHESEMNVHKCPECGSLFKSSEVLEEHQKQQHSNKKGRYSCHRCPSSFNVKSQLDNHVLIHAKDNQKPHACPVCKKCFSWWPSLITHMGQEHGGVENTVAGAENSA